jgi:hypothetical protein
VVVPKHIDGGIESLEQITEAINSGNETIKEKDKQQSRKQYIEN